MHHTLTQKSFLWTFFFFISQSIAGHGPFCGLYVRKNIISSKKGKGCTSLQPFLLFNTFTTFPVHRYQVRSDTMTQRDILNEIVLRKGIRYLWKGVTPYFMRMFVYTTGHLMFFEFFAEKFFRKEDKKV